MNGKKFAAIKYYPKDNEWKDITDEIIKYEYNENSGKKPYFTIYYLSGKTYFDSLENFHIFKDPEKLDIQNFIYFHNNIPLINVKEILLFKNENLNKKWVHVFFENDNYYPYDWNEITCKKNARSNDKINYIMNYLLDVARITNDSNNNILLNQINDLVILEESIAFKYLNGSKIEKIDTIDPDTLIYPFSCNESQKKAVKNALTHNMSVIQGPPGTGKTQTILNLISNILMLGKSVAVVSGNNEATRNVKDKMRDIGIDLITAFLGNKDNVKEHFLEDHNNIMSFKDWPLDNYDNSLENKTTNLNKRYNKLLETNLDILKNKNLLSELEIEKAITESENLVKSNIKDKIDNKHFTVQKILNLKAELELLPDKKLKGFFTKLRLLFKYGVFTDKEIINNRIESLNYLEYKYYDLKINEIKKQNELNEKFLQENKMDIVSEEIKKYSEVILKNYLFDNYIHENLYNEYTIDKYKLFFDEFIKRFPVIFSTTHSLEMSSGYNFLYDYVIIDEASQVDILSALIALSCAKNVVLVGDLKQLPHIVASEKRNLLSKLLNNYSINDNYEYVNNSILKSFVNIYKEKIPNVMLNIHYRCDPEIIGFSNKRFYNGDLIINSEHIDGNCVKVIYTESHHARIRINERQIDIIEKEILPNLNSKDIGIIAPYRDQVELMKERFDNKNYIIDTVHKFQGKEKDVIILSTVSNDIKIDDNHDNINFLNDPNLINVAISRAKKELHLIISEKIMKKSGAILSDFCRYIKYYCSEGIVEKTHIFSVLDLQYNDYSPILEEYKKKIEKISDFDSENIIGTIIKEICAEQKYGILDFKHNYALYKIVKEVNANTKEELTFLKNPNTHCDFVIFDKLDKSIKMVVEVDGMQHRQKIQINRDIKKNNLLKKAGIPILRLNTTASDCKEKIENILHSIYSNK